VPTFRVTHPFHPLRGREFGIVTVRQNWAHSFVDFHDDDQQLQSVPLAWTSPAPQDPAVLLAGGQALFRLADLLELARLLRALREPQP
jgi:hypothetical protein